MKLIRKLNKFQERPSGKLRLGLFKCPICKKLIEKGISNGKRDKSCGCIQYINYHGLSNHPLHKRWSVMKQRCYTSKHPGHIKHYQKRGIIVCKEWKDSFQTFYDWAINNGFKKELQLDRRDNDKGYSPDNCRWVTPIINMQNSPQCILTEKQANEIISLKNQGCRNVDIAKFYDIIETTCSMVGRVNWLNIKEKLA